MQRNFTLESYRNLLSAALYRGYKIFSVEDYFTQNYNNNKVIILRHDVDKKPMNSFYIAEIEKELNIKSTYYFRMLNSSNDPNVINKIASLGHEIGYHYEDLALAKGNYSKAIKNFELNLKYFRQFYDVKTICMHGSPLSKWDNKLLWLKYNYRDYGLIAEPFFDINFTKFIYITDTGGLWNNEDSNLRDYVLGQPYMNIQSTKDLISKIKLNKFANEIHLNTHPQRWNDKMYPWLKDLISQTLKNKIKLLIKKSRMN